MDWLGIKKHKENIQPIIEYDEGKTVELIIRFDNQEVDGIKIDLYYIPGKLIERADFIGTILLKDLKKFQHDASIDFKLVINIDEQKKIHARLTAQSAEAEQNFVFIFSAALIKKQLEDHVQIYTEQKKFNPLRLVISIAYGLVVLFLLFFLVTQTFEVLSLQNLFGINL